MNSLNLNDDILARLSELRKLLKNEVLDDAFLSEINGDQAGRILGGAAGGGCGANCLCTCAYHCENECSGSCAGVRNKSLCATQPVNES